LKGIAAALATRFGASVPDIRRSLKEASIEEWGKVRRVDSDEGDTMHAFMMVKMGEDNRDASYVRVCVLHYDLLLVKLSDCLHQI
jgi:hypothetical protein